jgi:DNA-binding transcriptional regulator YdaS (Cro superfamily)
MPTVYARTLRRAAEIAGGVQQLGSKLGVSSEDLVYWLQGTKAVPQEIFLRAVDIVVAHDISTISGKHPNVKNPAPEKPD